MAEKPIFSLPVGAGQVATKQGLDKELNRVADALWDRIDAKVGAVIANGGIVGKWDASTGLLPAARPDGSPINRGDTWLVTVPGEAGGENFQAADYLQALKDNPRPDFEGDWQRAAVGAQMKAADRAEAAADRAEQYDGPRFITVQQMLLSAASYSDWVGVEKVRVDLGGFTYSIADPAATDQHFTTAGGVKLYVDQTQSGWVVEAFDNGSSGEVAWQKAIDACKAAGGGRVHLMKDRTLGGTVRVWGTFGYKGIHITGDNVQVSSPHAWSAIQFRPDPRPEATDPAPQLKQRSEMSGITFNGPGRDVVGSAGIEIRDGATADVRHCKARNFRRGLFGEGALICRFTELELSANGWGVYLTSTATFAPNDIHFNSCKIFENTRAVLAEKFPNGVITFNECEMEGNNATGNASDGIAVFDFDRAGTVNIIGGHLEHNFGQWHIRYAGGATQSALNIIGSQLIPGNNNTSIIEMSNLYGSYGHLQVVGARISSGLSSQIVMGAGTSACIIGDPVGNITGDLSRVMIVRNGRIATGVNSVANFAGIRAKGSSNIGLDVEGLSRFVNAGNTRLGYSQVTEGGAFAFVSDQNNQGIQFNTTVGGTSAARFHINRLGVQAIEPGTNNTQTLGTATLRWSEVFAANGTINTSDGREKQDIAHLDDAEQRVAAALKGLIRKYRWKDAVEKKGDAARWHVGVIAQDVIAAFASEGLDAQDYGVLCYDEWDASDEILADDGSVLTPAQEAGNRYGVRYDQLWAFIISAV